MGNIHYYLSRVVSEDGPQRMIAEIHKKAKGVESKFFYTVDLGYPCECNQYKRHGQCIHHKILAGELEGEEIPTEEVDKIVKLYKRSLRKDSPSVVTVGNTRTRRRPVTRIELLAQSNTPGAEVWTFYGDYLVRMIIVAEEDFDMVMDKLNSKEKK